MKLRTTLLVSFLISGLGGVSLTEFNEQLALVDADFAKHGPTVEVLNGFEQLLKGTPDNAGDVEFSAILAKTWYRKAIVNLSLGKDSNAINDLERSMTWDPNNAAVKKNLLDLLVKYGNRDKLKGLGALINPKDPLYSSALDQIHRIEELEHSGDLEKLGEAIIISPFDAQLRERRIQLIHDKIKSSDGIAEQNALFADLINDYTVMIKVNPAIKSENWNTLSNINLFGLGEYSTALNANKKCLHYDMDNANCKMNSKLLNKYSSILTQLSHQREYYASLQENNDEKLELEAIDIKDLATSLTKQDKFLKIRRVNEQFKTNLDFILHKAKEFNDEFNLKYNQLEMTIYTTLAMDAILRHDSAMLKTYGKKLPEDSLPRSLIKIDKALHSKEFHQAHQMITQLPKNMQKCSFVSKRLEKIQEHNQQQQHQQRQHRQRQYQQQQQQHHQRPPSKPKNDYYAILNIDKTADEREIKKAYREASKLYHPDKYKGDLSPEEVEDKMTQINMAYEVLSDPKSRKDYDLGIDPNDHESQHQHNHQRQQRYTQHAGGNPFGGFGNGGFQFHFGNGGGGNFHFG